MDPLTIGAILVGVAASGLSTFLSKFVRAHKFRHSQKVKVTLQDGKELTIELPIDSDDRTLQEAIEKKLREKDAAA